MSKVRPLIVIVGETASGKSNLSLYLAQQYNGEIINADAWNVYKEMNIGTAKPSLSEMGEVEHHLIDIVEPDADYTAAQFQRDALSAIDTVHKKNKLPLLVGGNGLYVDSVLFNYSFLPPGKINQRQTLNSKSIPELLKYVEKKGYDTTGIDTRNKRRIIRLIENEGKRPTKSTIRPNTLILGVKLSRSQLRKNIEQRVELMFKKGLRKEVDELVNKYGWEPEAMKGIGYAEFKQYYEGVQSMTQTKQRIVSSTLKLAKRQRTWFKRNQSIQWVDSADHAADLVDDFLNTH